MASSPKYLQAYQTLRDEILYGRYLSDNQFPSVVGASRRFGISRLTTVKVFDKLKSEGLIRSKPGSGTFVTKRGNCRKIGLLVPDFGRSEFFQEVVKTVSGFAERNDYSVVFGEVSAKTDRGRVVQVERLAREFVKANISGLIYQPIDYVTDSVVTNRRVLSCFDDANIPVVLCDYDFVESPNRSGYDVVGVNNIEAGALMVDHLMSIGSRRIHFHLAPLAPLSHRNYIRGAISEYRDRLEGRSAKDTLLVADCSDIRAITEYCRTRHPDTFVCASDLMAAQLRNTLETIGYSVPDDIMLTGVDDLRTALARPSQLTTIHLPCCQIAEAAFNRLVARIANPEMPTMEMLLPVKLIVRESTIRKPGKRRRK